MKNLLYLFLMVLMSSCCQQKYLYNKQYFEGKFNFNPNSERQTSLVTRLNSSGTFSDDGSYLCKTSEIENFSDINYNDKVYFRLIKKCDIVYATDITKNAPTRVNRLNIEDNFGRFYLHQLYLHPEDPNHNKFHKFQKLSATNCNNLFSGRLLRANGTPIDQKTYHMTSEDAEYYENPPVPGPFYFETTQTVCPGNIKKMTNISTEHNHPGH